MKTNQIVNQKQLTIFLKELKASRLAKNLSEQKLRDSCVPKVSRRSWWQWTRKLKKGEKREFPNPSHVERLKKAVKNLKKQPVLLKGRPKKKI